MAETKSSLERRCRGRPQLRPDDETRRIIYDAARHEFAANGYAATSTEMVARRAGISTKTLYRLAPNHAARFESLVSHRLHPLGLATAGSIAAGAPDTIRNTPPTPPCCCC